MKEETIEQMIDALAAEGRVRRLAQHDCADLPLWGRRRQRRADRLRYAAAAAVVALLLPTTVAVKPLPYNLAENVSYETVVELIQESLLL